MNNQNFPGLDPDVIAPTRDALHAYSQVLGSWPEACRPRRKHWWHISLRPTVRGLSTGLVHANIDFELQLDLRASVLSGQVAGGGELGESLQGQSAVELADLVKGFLVREGMSPELAPDPDTSQEWTQAWSDYQRDTAAAIARAWTSIAGALATLRAGIPEETSPIQLWPHHFDLAMVWLPGEKIAGQDPADEEHSDKQMNIGFTLGDAGIPEPYFYVTAYPQPDALPDLPLPDGTTWHTEGFSGAVLLYRDLLEQADPERYLLDLWRALVAAGREHLLENS